jgi:hypothetical protein
MKPGIGNGESGIDKVRWLSCFYLPLYKRGIEGDLLFATLATGSEGKSKSKSFRAGARVTFVLPKVTKSARAGRDPGPKSGPGPLRFSEVEARRPNSLRSNKGASSASPSCDARFALRREGSKGNSNSIDKRAGGQSREFVGIFL